MDFHFFTLLTSKGWGTTIRSYHRDASKMVEVHLQRASEVLDNMIEEHGAYFRGPTSFRFVFEWCINVHGESYCSVLMRDQLPILVPISGYCFT